MTDLINLQGKLEYENLAKHIVNRLEWLGSFAKDPEGGITRLLYSQQWTDTQQALKRWMEDEGLEVKFDEVGNLSGILKGVNQTETVLTGSHIDTVKNGGLFDGQFGIVAGVLALIYLKDHYGTPERNLEVVSLAEEEGSRFPYCFWGSKNIAGCAYKKDVENLADSNGIIFSDAINEAGFRFRDETLSPRQDLKVFVEVHVEQGNVLETEKKSVGIVKCIVGQRRFTIEVKGQANHAGTTPMGYRRDAVYAASQMIYETLNMADQYGDPLVATVGRVDISPNIANVVPGKAAFTLDLRHIDKNTISHFTERFIEKINDISREHGVETVIEKWLDTDPVPMDPEITEIIEKKCKEKNLSYKVMHSGAGHDAQIFAASIPAAMLFVPSKKGISHNPGEYTAPADLAEGVKALISTLYELAYK
ncbi:allantoate deiminase [Cytobacillus sp. FSL H8-0458]|uniref:allantoate deiminase n=1 Tax=Cytobacillus sp. FSL H8-0458 TaxID=2975346 RepID=UPI0030F634A6